MKAPKPLSELRVQIYADGAKSSDMISEAKNPLIKGFTTNPTLMHKAGITDYLAFAKEILSEIRDKPISFEVFADDFAKMERQARLLATLGKNVYVKIPITNSQGESTSLLIGKLSKEGIKLNVTMITTVSQVEIAVSALDASTPSIVSVFAGRAADLGFDPMALMHQSKVVTSKKPAAALLWASTREVYNIYQAEEIGTEIITVPPPILEKAFQIGATLAKASLQGVQTFYEDGRAAGFTL